MQAILSIQETGHENALFGMSLSFYDRQAHGDPHQWFSQDKLNRAKARAKLLAHQSGGHNKFLESINVQMLVKGTRAFWQEMDTYRVGITKQSASTMHVLTKREQTKDDFSPNTDQRQIDVLNEYIRNKASIDTIKENLPEGYLQIREISTNYMTLKNIYWQRRGHKYGFMRNFANELLSKLEHPYYIIKDSK